MMHFAPIHALKDLSLSRDSYEHIYSRRSPLSFGIAALIHQSNPSVHLRLYRPKKADTFNPVGQFGKGIGPPKNKSRRITDQIIASFLPHDHDEVISAVVTQTDDCNDGIFRQQIRVDQVVGSAAIVSQF